MELGEKLSNLFLLKSINSFPKTKIMFEISSTKEFFGPEMSF